MSAALNQNLELLRQGVELLRRLDDETYRGEDTSLQISYRVGPHLRHCIDAYGCLLQGLAKRRVDYDGRQRLPEIEAEREIGLRALEEIATALDALREEDPHTEIEVKVDTTADEPGAWSHSTLRRELQFLVGHTVHHYALIAMILRGGGFDPGRDFGVAPSTLRHWAREESLVG